MSLQKSFCYTGDAVKVLQGCKTQQFNTCITSPPYYGQRDYGVEGQIGREETPEEFVENLVAVFREVRRVLRDDGTVWLNLGDSYSGSGKGRNKDGSRTSLNDKQSTNRGAVAGKLVKTKVDLPRKNLIGIPWRVAFALQADGWYLRQDIIWHKPNPMPEPVKDRCVTAHEYIFLLSKNENYHFDAAAIREPAQNWGMRDRSKGKYTSGDGSHGQNPHSGLKDCDYSKTGRNKRGVWTIAPKPFKGAHFATFPPEVVLPCVLAGAPAGGWVLDPFAGSGTTGMVASQQGRKSVMIDLNPEYKLLQAQRIGAGFVDVKQKISRER